VDAFLEESIRFPEMAEVVAGVLEELGRERVGSLEQILEIDREARVAASAVVDLLKRREPSRAT